MFNSITGTITAKQPVSIYIDNNGIEWDISVPALSLDSFGTVGSSARVYTWLYHREDQMRIFGFASPRERPEAGYQDPFKYIGSRSRGGP